MSKITICTYNIENFFIKEALVNKLSDDEFLLLEQDYLKSNEELLQMSHVLADIDADIYGLSEVGHIESLHYFNEKYLDSKYIVYHKKGNSSRGIEIAYLVNKRMNNEYEFKISSFEHRAFKNPYNETQTDFLKSKGSINFKLSRNLLCLEIYKNSKLIMQSYLCHLKSARDEAGIDFRSRIRRASELELCLTIIEENKKKAPIIFMGDFNGNASKTKTDPEFTQIYESCLGFFDALEPLALPLEHRATYFVFNRKRRVAIQLDYIFISSELSQKYIDAGIYRYKNELNRPKPMPKSKAQVLSNPSDHYPLILELETP